ncbi:hypothetical protein EAX61_05145 [Dokdonia sinensis]|uniref:Uncharacterized protein n=1 Tax=Dokdonia sinensis TaxID=2479847 RepID=A0A3M0GF80_9FLAO|nr:hypothetical protein EAX61_05145 [Dokdonia sinensis]
MVPALSDMCVDEQRSGIALVFMWIPLLQRTAALSNDSPLNVRYFGIGPESVWRAVLALFLDIKKGPTDFSIGP